MVLPLRSLRLCFGPLLLCVALSACDAPASQPSAQTAQVNDAAPGTIATHINGRVNFYAAVGGSN